ncbi:uncharacterized protein ACB058_001672 [Synchiropus picturatus]
MVASRVGQAVSTLGVSHALMSSASTRTTKIVTTTRSQTDSLTVKKVTQAKTQSQKPTTIDRTTKKPPEPPQPVVRVHVFTVSFVMPNEPSNGIEDSSSAAYKSLRFRVISFCFFLYSRFDNFIQIVIIRFRIFVRSVRTGGVEAEIRIEFNGSTPLSELPTNSEIARVIVNGSSLAPLFNISGINTTSVQVTDSPHRNTSIATTISPTPRATTTALTVKPVTAGITVTRRITFTSRTSTFVVDLLNPTSDAFKERASLIKNQLEPKFKEAFPALISFLVVSFSNGSVINNADVKFPFASVPTNEEIANLLRNITVVGFDIDTSSILVDGAIIASNGVGQDIRVVSALCLLVVSMLLL